MKNNHKPLQFELKGEAGKRVALAQQNVSLKRITKKLKRWHTNDPPPKISTCDSSNDSRQ